MSEIKFSCPNCQQHIQADEGYCGMEISCPTCQARMVVPGTPRASGPPSPPPPQLARREEAPAASKPCPQCGTALTPEAILCVHCGYNLRTKQNQRPPSPGKASRPTSAASKWYATPYPYLGALAVVFVVLYFLGRDNEMMKGVFALLALLFILTARILVTIAGFKDSAGKWILCLCIEIYTIYFVYRESESTFLQVLYGMVLLLYLMFYTMK